MWVVASFMNHDKKPNTSFVSVGTMMFVMASYNMEAGTELTTMYAPESDPSLEQWF